MIGSLMNSGRKLVDRASLRVRLKAQLWGAILAFFAALAIVPPAAAQQDAKFERLTLVAQSGRHDFQVEVMRNDAQRAQGLMFRRNMAADHGMLFDFEREAPVSMWMKNTYLPLDMIFIDRRGRIVNIAENTEPLSERTIPSARPVLAVLEVNAGTARRLRLKAGDQVEHSMFKR